MLLIAVAGGTCSGKTTLAHALAGKLGDGSVVIPLDNYYLASDLPLEQRAELKHDLPSAFDWPLVRCHLRSLSASEAIEMPVYNYEIHNRTAETVRIDPPRTAVFEGLYALYDEEIRGMTSLAIFLDSRAKERRERRLARDLEERGTSREYTARKFDLLAEPAYREHVEPTRRWADIVASDPSDAERRALAFLRTLENR